MIRSGNLIRLHPADKKRLALLTGSTPDGVRTAEGLNRFIDIHLPQFAQDTPEARLITLLLCDEKALPASMAQGGRGRER